MYSGKVGEGLEDREREKVCASGIKLGGLGTKSKSFNDFIEGKNCELLFI